jgi:hypothetical protein
MGLSFWVHTNLAFPLLGAVTIHLLISSTGYRAPSERLSGAFSLIAESPQPRLRGVGEWAVRTGALRIGAASACQSLSGNSIRPRGTNCLPFLTRSALLSRRRGGEKAQMHAIVGPSCRSRWSHSSLHRMDTRWEAQISAIASAFPIQQRRFDPSGTSASSQTSSRARYPSQSGSIVISQRTDYAAIASFSPSIDARFRRLRFLFRIAQSSSSGQRSWEIDQKPVLLT